MLALDAEQERVLKLVIEQWLKSRPVWIYWRDPHRIDIARALLDELRYGKA